MSGDQDGPSDVDDILASFGTVLRDEATWADPPSGLLEGIIAAREGESIAASRSPANQLVAASSIRRSSPGPSRRLLAIAAAVAVAFAAGMFVARDDNGAASPVAARVSMDGTALMPGATAIGKITDPGAGFAIRLDVEGLEPAPAGTYYEGWVRSPAGDVVSVGTFHMWGGDGAVVLWAGVPLDEYPDLVVTRQVERDDVGGRFDAADIVLQGPLRPES